MARKPSGYVFPTASAERVEINAATVAGFVETFLQDGFDNPHPIPDFHKELWELACLPDRRVAIAAPRGHAKSTAGTLSFTLASLLFGTDDFAVILSSSERLAVGHLKNLKTQLWENEPLRDAFNLEVIRDVETELVCRVRGREFCIMAFGAEANLRGALWRQKRPSLFIIDDIENDELVMNPDRREKMRNWLFNAVLPAGSDNARYRMWGTILHLDSLLERLLSSPQWTSRRFRAHADFDDFSQLLWPEKWSEARLRDERQAYVEMGNASGYSQEYLSHPIAESDAYFRKSDFLPLPPEKRRVVRVYYGAIDFAISTSERADRTVFVLGGVDAEGMLTIMRVEAGRWDGLQIINKWFQLDHEFRPVFWLAEQGAIERVLKSFLHRAMRERNHFMQIEPRIPVKDKRSRARPLQARMRAGAVWFDTETEWFPAYQQELLSFDRGIHDDMVDATAWLAIAIDELGEAPNDEEISEEEYQELLALSDISEGRSAATGY